jgi:hypothetical protein
MRSRAERFIGSSCIIRIIQLGGASSTTIEHRAPPFVDAALAARAGKLNPPAHTEGRLP